MNSPVKIASLVPGGQGIGTDSDGKKGFFWNALPGETITKYSITKQKSTYFEAIAEEITDPSSARIAPQDPCFLSTSPWQIMSYPEELAQKSLLLAEIFRQAGLDAVFPNLKAITRPVVTNGQDFFYRNKMEYSLYWDKENAKINLAFHLRGSHRKIPISRSSIERPEIFQAAIKIIEDLNAKREEARKYQSLLLRANQSGEISGGLYENHQPHPVFADLKDSILGQKYSYSPNGFFQINLPVYELALTEIKKYIITNNILDLYAGVGTIGLSVARGKQLTLVESNPAAYQELQKNCTASANTPSPVNTVTNPAISPAAASNTSASAHPIFAKSEEALDYIQRDQTVILDPPRAGCDSKLLAKLLKKQPVSIIYLSCNPVTQARDLKILSKIYHPVNITPYNFFPRTPHLENLVILEYNR